MNAPTSAELLIIVVSIDVFLHRQPSPWGFSLDDGRWSQGYLASASSSSHWL